jgi:hypothetical protein
MFQVAVLLGEAEQRSARQPQHMTANDAQAQVRLFYGELTQNPQ